MNNTKLTKYKVIFKKNQGSNTWGWEEVVLNYLARAGIEGLKIHIREILDIKEEYIESIEVLNNCGTKENITLKKFKKQ